MSITLSTLHSKTPIKTLSPKNLPRIHHNTHFRPLISSSSATSANPLPKLHISHNFYGPLKKSFSGFSIKPSGFIVKAQNEGGLVNNGEKEENEGRGQSSMPERFRYLSKEAPDQPVRWPWLIVLAFGLYAWRTVLWELSNWKTAIGSIFQFFIYISKLILALILHFIGDPLTSSIKALETTLYALRAFYSGLINYTPIPDLTISIILTSAILSISEATVPDSVNRQPYILTVAGVIGFAAVKSYISETFFWALLLGLFCYGRLVKKRDDVASVLPVAAVLAGVGETWVRVVVIGAYLALAIFQKDVKEDESGVIKQVPFPLICAALAIGVRVAAKWVGYRHLTWMIV